METKLKEVLAICRRNKRVCPNPQEWARIWEILPNRKRVGSTWYPPLPLILSAWVETSDEEKRQRFEEHLRWAHDHRVLQNIVMFILSLSEDQWYHARE